MIKSTPQFFTGFGGIKELLHSIFLGRKVLEVDLLILNRYTTDIQRHLHRLVFTGREVGQLQLGAIFQW